MSFKQIYLQLESYDYFNFLLLQIILVFSEISKKIQTLIALEKSNSVLYGQRYS